MRKSQTRTISESFWIRGNNYHPRWLQRYGLPVFAALPVVLAQFNRAPFRGFNNFGIGNLITAIGTVALGNLAVILFSILHGFFSAYAARE